MVTAVVMEAPHALADALRALALSMIGLAAGISAHVFYLYAKRLRLAPSPGRLLAWHVCAISLAHTILLMAYGFEVYEQMGGPITFRTGVALVAAGLTLTALIILRRWILRARPSR
jgi:hypothetical protein